MLAPRNGRREQHALRVVLAPIELDDRAPEQRLGLRGIAARRELGLVQRGLHVVEAAQDPGARRGVEVQRVVVAHAPVGGVGVVGECRREDVRRGVAAVVAMRGRGLGSAM